MKRQRIFKSIALLAAAALIGVMATGCSGLPEKAEGAISNTAKALEDVSLKAADNWKDDAKVDGRYKELTAEEETGSAVKLKVDHSVGNIDIKNISGTKITVKSTIWASESVFKKNDMQKVFDQAEASISIKGDTISILTHAKGNSEKDLWNWSQREYGYSDFSIDYEIGLPSNVTVLDVSNDVGQVSLANVSGEYRIQNDVGTIEIAGAHFMGNSSVKSSTGSIVLDAQQIDKDAGLEAVADIGSIEAKLADKVSCILDIKTDVGSISGASKGESKRGDGGPRISLSTSVGSIDVI